MSSGGRDPPGHGGECTALPRPLAALRALPDKTFSDQKCIKCRLAAGLRLDAVGELIALLQTPSCIETPGAFGARSSAPTAPRLTHLAFGDRAFRFFFFPIRTLVTAIAVYCNIAKEQQQIANEPTAKTQQWNNKHIFIA